LEAISTVTHINKDGSLINKGSQESMILSCDPVTRDPCDPDKNKNFQVEKSKTKQLKVGDRVTIKSPHFLAGKIGVISSLVEIVELGDRPTTFEAIITNPSFAVSPSVPIDKLERVA
jgi:hypothetical protein